MIDKERTEAEALFFQGTSCMQAGDDAAAEDCFREALRIVPDFAEAYANLGLLLEKKGDLAAAEQNYRRSIELNPAHPETHLNLGALLAYMKRFNEAELAYMQAILLRQDSPAGWSNLGVLYACMKREEEAERCYRTALALDDSYRTARFNLSYLLLRQGRFEEGWPCLDARNWLTELARHLACPRWQGESLIGKSILIGYEAGHGDMIQFCRYAAVLKRQGATSITLICHPALKTLFSSLEDVDSVIALDEPIPSSGWDFWTPLLSIPRYCDTRIDSIPANIPYLFVPEEAMEKWGTLLPQDGLRVGLVWKGNPLFENDADRSLPGLDMLVPLAAVPGVRFISLQKGAGEAEALAPPAGLPITHIGSQLADFADTAAVVMNLDLVICVDTAIAHLAGALGKPCWVLLPDYKPDWRWMAERSDSPWYPGTMRLFRQPAMGDWKSVIVELVAALEQWQRQQAALFGQRGI
ncbi:tetratricopeptide repeat protein [Sideroxydans lithotrophicus]|uniref:TPR repeat-containing protein n=1 Tax=Sideroxydans lithotrophicus (strain ES-1) TaxID=580332 RepID=D5CMY0_SIDLE|nr:tetratricopeptide repeat protein [Sideroxydans lithotrophicus]ADE10816.1 TPR repeat-containing protein [Sideroxydans lithotrophicus ES-1]